MARSALKTMVSAWEGGPGSRVVETWNRYWEKKPRKVMSKHTAGTAMPWMRGASLKPAMMAS
jgi:hypothetical protein